MCYLPSKRPSGSSLTGCSNFRFTVKELDFGRIVLRINENDESDKEDVVAQVAMDTKMFLE